MRKKSYWKECCLLLIGLILGCLYQKHFGSLPIKKETTTIKKDTVIIRDTIFSKITVPPLSKKSVYLELKKQKIPHAEIVLAQSILETGHYKSDLTKTHNNIFGIKKGKEYKKYNSYIDCIKDYKKLISSRYSGGSYYNYLLKIGYASDPEYIDKLKDIV